MKHKPILLIVVGALASIATEGAEGWYAWTGAAMAMATLDDTTPQVRYLVHAELHGPGPYQGLYGWIEAQISATPVQTSNVVSIEIRSLTHPDQIPTTGGVYATRMIASVYLQAWLACDVDPCVEDFEVTIKRDPGLVLPPITITGTATSQLNGPSDQKEAPPGTSIDLTVTGPMP